jgi:hypothetical protein
MINLKNLDEKDQLLYKNIAHKYRISPTLLASYMETFSPGIKYGITNLLSQEFFYKNSVREGWAISILKYVKSQNKGKAPLSQNALDMLGQPLGPLQQYRGARTKRNNNNTIIPWDELKF